MHKSSGFLGSPLALFLCIASLTFAVPPFGQRRAFGQKVGSPVATAKFVDVTEVSGIDFIHFSGRSGKHYIYETVTTGLATFDYDNDGLIDVYLPSGKKMDGNSKPDYKNRLFKNLGDMKFVDVTESSGAGDIEFALGVTIGDFDNDGDSDIFVSNFGPTVLLQNNGDGTFLRRAFSFDSQDPPMGSGVALLDCDRDGDLDLFVANYVRFDPTKGMSRKIFGKVAAPGPGDYEPGVDMLYQNLGDDNFRDISQSSGISQFAAPGMGVLAYDFDHDGDDDIFVCNDTAANFMYENLGGNQFDEIGLLAGVAYDLTSGRQASMGADVGDFNRDGLLDIATTNFSEETPTLYQFDSAGFFDDVGPAVGFGVADRFVTWGIALADLDNDALLDAFVATGHINDIVESSSDYEQYATANITLLQRGGKFLKANAPGGAVAGSRQVTRGICVDDLDNDGDLDIVCLNSNDRPQLLENQSTSKNEWLQVQLVGTTSNRDAVGARVILKDSSGQEQLQVVVSGRGYQSHYGSRLHFGLGEAQASELQIEWPSGTKSSLELDGESRRLIIVEPAPAE